VKAAIRAEDLDDGISVMRIFRFSAPYWVIILLGMIIIAIFPEIATYLPNLLFKKVTTD
jgi:TRAP-type C4-dicarboxylate transport system permease large subunit